MCPIQTTGEAEDRCVALRYAATELAFCKLPITSKPSRAQHARFARGASKKVRVVLCRITYRPVFASRRAWTEPRHLGGVA